jgi:hypothetical protein
MMKIKEAIDKRDELNGIIENFFDKICLYYVQNSPLFSHNPKLEFSDFHYLTSEIICISLRSRWNDCHEFSVNSAILEENSNGENWKQYIDETVIIEQSKINDKIINSITKKSNDEKAKLKELIAIYGIPN